MAIAYSEWNNAYQFFSALSLRVFGEDITVFGKEVHQKYVASQKRKEEFIANTTEEVIDNDFDKVDVTVDKLNNTSECVY